MEFNGKQYTGDVICASNLDNRQFVKESVKMLDNISKYDNFWHGFNNTSIGNILLLLNHSSVITQDEKDIIKKVLSKLPNN
jgi:hypothetical protein